jgi:hypothetical protein
MVDHLVEMTAFHVQLQAIVLSLNVLQSQCIMQAAVALWTIWLKTQQLITHSNVLSQVETLKHY